VGQKEQTLLEFYENQLKDITDKVKNIESTELEDAQKETQKIIDLLKPKETKVAPETKPAKP
jgi:CHASE3 domain sensor protein